MCSAQGNRADISNPSVRCGDTESRQGTEAMLRSSRANIKSCCPGPSGLHHCVSSKGLTCAAPTASMAAYTVPTACRVLSWLILFPAPFLNRYFINLASLPCWGLPCISFLLHSCISTLFLSGCCSASHPHRYCSTSLAFYIHAPPALHDQHQCLPAA